MKQEGYFITEQAKERFRKYLFDERISFAEFARRTGVSRQYLDSIIKGKKRITKSAIEHFRKGGYELL